MARRTRAREIPRMLEAGMPGNAISRALSVPKHSVQAVAEAADEHGIGRAEAEAMSDAEAYEALFPEKVRDRDVYADPDWERIHRELARDGVTPKRLHAEYRDALLAKAACQRRMRAHYVRCPGLEDLWRGSRERAGGERKLTRRYATFQVLVLDEWLLDRPGELFRGFLLELMGVRCGACSTVFCTRFRQKDWHARLGGGVRADAIMARMVHGTAWVEMGELNMRRKLGSEAG